MEDGQGAAAAAVAVAFGVDAGEACLGVGGVDAGALG